METPGSPSAPPFSSNGNENSKEFLSLRYISFIEQGEALLEELVQAAHDVLYELEQVMKQQPNGKSGGQGTGPSHTATGLYNGVKPAGDSAREPLGGLLAAQRRYVALSQSLRKVLMQIQDLQEGFREAAEDDDGPSSLRKLEARSLSLRKEIESKNVVVKNLIDGARRLQDDLKLWQSLPLA
eukprot:jgi/Mesen1/3443/ME000194S02588